MFYKQLLQSIQTPVLKCESGIVSEYGSEYIYLTLTPEFRDCLFQYFDSKYWKDTVRIIKPIRDNYLKVKISRDLLTGTEYFCPSEDDLSKVTSFSVKEGSNLSVEMNIYEWNSRLQKGILFEAKRIVLSDPL